MPDLYATIGSVPKDVQERLAGVLEMRAAHARQQKMLRLYLSEIEFPDKAHELAGPPSSPPPGSRNGDVAQLEVERTRRKHNADTAQNISGRWTLVPEDAK